MVGASWSLALVLLLVTRYNFNFSVTVRPWSTVNTAFWGVTVGEAKLVSSPVLVTYPNCKLSDVMNDVAQAHQQCYIPM